VDYNGNQKIDLLHEEQDAIGSVANYMKSYGWLANQPVATLANLNAELCVSDLKTPRSMADWAIVGIVPQLPNTNYPAARISDFTLGDTKEFWLVFNNFEVITKYNNSDFYAMSVLQLAEAIKAARANR
jgi:membrane-bound lytic murein transglycosylase B